MSVLWDTNKQDVENCPLKAVLLWLATFFLQGKEVTTLHCIRVDMMTNPD